MSQNPSDSTHGLSVQHADALWDAVAIPGPTEPTFPMQHERVCRAVAGILAEVTAASGRATVYRELADQQTQLAVADDLARLRDIACARRQLVKELRRLAAEVQQPETDGAGEPAELRTLPREVRRLVHAVDRMRSDWAEAPEHGPERRELWTEVHSACDAVWDRLDTTGAEAQQQPDTETPPVCQGFVWIGQSFAICDRCGQPAWEHVGEEVPVEGAGPFDSRRTVRPWAPGQADRIRAKWGTPAEADTDPDPWHNDPKANTQEADLDRTQEPRQ